MDIFLSADDRDVRQDAGKITAEITQIRAESEFEKYRIIQARLFQSDFDRFVELEEHAENCNGGIDDED